MAKSKINIYYYLTAYNVASGNTERVDTIESQEKEEIDSGIILEAKNNPETAYILKESFLSLSDDARIVIDFVIDSPEEVFEVLFNKRNNVSVMKIKRLINKSFGAKKTRKIFREIKSWLRSI